MGEGIVAEFKRTAIIDVDTLIFHAALAGQKTHIKVTGKNTGRTMTFDNRTQFWGHWKLRSGGWLADFNSKREAKGLSLISPDVFDVEDVTELVGDGGVSPEAVVKGRFKNKIEAITRQDWCKDFKICFGTGTNFRYEIAQTTPYKEDRPTKPLLHAQVKEYMLWKYKEHMVIVDGVETDDIVTSLMYESWERSGGDFEKLDSVSSFIDKDLSQYPCLHYNFDKPELGLVKIGPTKAARNLGIQFLKGDAIDSIPGLPQLPPDMFTKYGLRKPSKPGIGDKTAVAVLESAETECEIFSRIVEAYQGWYGDTPQPFVSFKGDTSERTWIDHMNEMYRLLRMRYDVTKDVGHVSDYLKSLGVNFG